MTEDPILIRQAGTSDAAALHALYVQVQGLHATQEPDFFRPPVSQEAFAAHLAERAAGPAQHLVLATMADRAVGFAQYRFWRAPATIYRSALRLAYIDGLVVDQAVRRRGVASRLLDHVKAEAATARIARIGVDHWSFNAAARACFQKAGFTLRKETLWLNG